MPSTGLIFELTFQWTISMLILFQFINLFNYIVRQSKLMRTKIQQTNKLSWIFIYLIAIDRHKQQLVYKLKESLKTEQTKWRKKDHFTIYMFWIVLFWVDCLFNILESSFNCNHNLIWMFILVDSTRSFFFF